jgi:hypothetical protein
MNNHLLECIELAAILLPGLLCGGPVELTSLAEHQAFCKPLIERSEMTQALASAEKEISRLNQELLAQRIPPKGEFETTAQYAARSRQLIAGMQAELLHQEQLRDDANARLSALQNENIGGPQTFEGVVCRIPVKAGAYDADTKKFENFAPASQDYCFGRDQGIPYVLHVPYTFQCVAIPIPFAKKLRELSDKGELFADIALDGVTLRCTEEEVNLPRSSTSVVAEVALRLAVIIASKGSTPNSLASQPAPLRETVPSRVISIDRLDGALVFRLLDKNGNVVFPPK